MLILLIVGLFFILLLVSKKPTPVEVDPMVQKELQQEWEQKQEMLRQEKEYFMQKKKLDEQEKDDQRVPIYEKYERVYRFEILYWRAVSKPWWWNNYAKDLVEYADTYFPINKINYYQTYNSNSKGEDYAISSVRKRITTLRPHKISKHPLVVINYDQEYIMIDSYYALQEMMDRIDAEWYRHFHFQKTYRNSPTTYKK